MCSKAMELLQEIKLRNKHLVYTDGHDFRVVSVKEQGVEHTRVIPSENIERLAELSHGKTLTPPQATMLFGAYCSDLDLPYTFGHQLKYYVQDMLLVLVATERAKMSKEGRGYVYHVGI
jgi:hypothetical protein